MRLAERVDAADCIHPLHAGGLATMSVVYAQLVDSCEVEPEREAKAG